MPVKSTEQINREILNWIQRDWNVQGEQFDPLVYLISGACAQELHKIYSEIDESENRVLERLVNLLLPHSITGAQPADALAYVHPKAARCTLQPFELSWQVKNRRIRLSQSQEESFAFSPLSSCNLVNAFIRFVLADSTFIHQSIDNHLDDRLNSKGSEETLWTDQLLFVVEFIKPVKNLDDISIYFDFQDPDGQDSMPSFVLSEILQSGEWRLQGQPVLMKKGRGDEGADLHKQFTSLHMMEESIERKYEHSFLSFSKDTRIPEVKYLNLGFDWPESDIQELQSKTRDFEEQAVFLEVKLPGAIPISSRTFFSFNVIPVINRQLERPSNEYYIREGGVHVVPIETQSHFLGIERVYERGNRENPFRFQSFSSFADEHSVNTYSVRERGLGHYDTYNFWSRFGFLLDKIRSEYQNQDLVRMLGNALTVEEVYKFIGNQELQNDGNFGPYLLVNSRHDKNRIALQVDFWSTDAELANNLPAGSIMDGNSPELMDDRSVLVSESLGGKPPMSRIDGIRYIQNLMVNRGKLVTKADIAAFTRSYLGNQLLHVALKEGTIISSVPGQGGLRCLEVHLDLQVTFAENSQLICQTLEREINSRTSSLIPVKVKVGKP